MTVKADIKRRAFGFREFAHMFSVSIDSVKRLWRTGDIATITVGGRRVIPQSEVDRVERQGVGTPRKRKAKATAAPEKAGEGSNVG